jgi:hypothetical protein
VLAIREIDPAEPLTVEPSVKTVVSDFRVSRGSLGGAPLVYIVDSKPIPTVTEVKHSNLYRITQNSAREAAALQSHSRVAFLALFLLLLLFPLFVMILKRKKDRSSAGPGNGPV